MQIEVGVTLICAIFSLNIAQMLPLSGKEIQSTIMGPKSTILDFFSKYNSNQIHIEVGVRDQFVLFSNCILTNHAFSYEFRSNAFVFLTSLNRKQTGIYVREHIQL
jgi:hypothetical protein